MDSDQGTLFDMPTSDDREQVDGKHVLMPNMAYACGGSILTKTGGFVFLSEGTWPLVGCPDCRALGYEPTMKRQREQQGR